MQEKTGIKHAFTRILVRSWWHLPLGRQGKEEIKTLVFTCLPLPFRNTRVYRNWVYTRSLGKPDFSFRPEDFPPHWPTKRSRPQAYRGPLGQPGPVQPLAIVIHVFYPDLFRDILQRLEGFAPDQCKLFVSTIREHRESVASLLRSSCFRHHLSEFDNRGRDILPFLKLSKQAIEEGHPLLLKLHTKRSNHRMSGELWRRELYGKLLKPDAVEIIGEVFARHPGVGLLGPAGHVVPMGLYYGGNALAVGYLAYRLGMAPQTLQGLHFIAGSMFYIRAAALQPLLDLDLVDELFEEERGQHDGTMAHAVERIFAVSNQVAGFTLADTSCSPENPGFRATSDHPFTW